MSVTMFEDLCRGVCHVAGVCTAAPVRDASGVTSMSIQVGGIETTLAHVPGQPLDGLVLMELGTIPPAIELPALLGLLEATFLMRAGAPTSIGRSDSGIAVLQTALEISTTTADVLHRHLGEMADFVHDWKRDYFVDAASEPNARRCIFSI